MTGTAEPTLGPFPKRQMASGEWEVLVSGYGTADGWVHCATAQEARAIAYSPVLYRDCLERRRKGEGFASELRYASETLRKCLPGAPAVPMSVYLADFAELALTW